MFMKTNFQSIVFVEVLLFYYLRVWGRSLAGVGQEKGSVRASVGEG